MLSGHFVKENCFVVGRSLWPVINFVVWWWRSGGFDSGTAGASHYF